MESADIWMIEGRDGTGFPLESLLRFGVLGQMVGKDLYGDGAIEASIEGTINLAHAACAER